MISSRSPVASGDQFTDFNPGIKPSGLFWTMAFDASAFDAVPGRGQARIKAENLPMRDFHDFGNSVSLNPTWVTGHVNAFTVSDEGSSAVCMADTAGQSNPIDPGVGHERNGVFFQ